MADKKTEQPKNPDLELLQKMVAELHQDRVQLRQNLQVVMGDIDRRLTALEQHVQQAKQNRIIIP